MRGVVLNAGRRVVDAAPLTRPADGGEFWRFNFPYDGVAVEAVLPGGPDGPEPAWLNLAERVAAQIEGFVAEARSYLRAFVNPEEVRGPCGPNCWGDWDLCRMEFGPRRPSRTPRTPRDPFELFFLLPEDTYGVWAVGFYRSDAERFYPNEFRRFQV